MPPVLTVCGPTWRRLALLCAAVVMVSPVVMLPRYSHAGQTDLRQTAQPAKQAYAGLDLSIDGLMPGMTYDAVKQRLDHLAATSKAQRVEIIPQAGTASLNGSSGSMSSKPFPTSLRLVEHLAGLNLRVWFATPATGGTATTIEEGMFYRSPMAKPATAEFKRSLAERFGPPSASTGDSLLPDGVRTEKLIWNFGGVGRIPCDRQACEIATAPNTLDTLPNLEKRLERGVCMIVTVSVSTYPDDPGHVGAYNVIIEDVASEVLTLQEARKQLEAAVGKP